MHIVMHIAYGASREGVLSYSACICFAPRLTINIAWSRVNVLCAVCSHTQLRCVMVPERLLSVGHSLRGI